MTMTPKPLDEATTLDAMQRMLTELAARVAVLEAQLVTVYAHEDEDQPDVRGPRTMVTPADVPGFVCIDHVAIAVPPGELGAQVQTYQALGFVELHREDVLGTDQVREVLLQIGGGPNLVQLLEPLSPDSPVARQIEKNGGRGGLAHVALRVADIQTTFETLKARGIRIIDEAPRPGSRGTTVFFIHPKTTEATALGYLLEVVQEGSSHG